MKAKKVCLCEGGGVSCELYVWGRLPKASLYDSCDSDWPALASTSLSYLDLQLN